MQPVSFCERLFCRDLEEDFVVGLREVAGYQYQVSNDRKVAYVLHRDKLLCLTHG